MRLTLNGERMEVDVVTLAELVALRVSDPATPVATAVNGAFVNKSRRSGFILSTDDAVELLTPMQGGEMQLYDQRFSSRLMLGTALYPSPQVMADAIRAARPALLTVSLRREGSGGTGFWPLLQALCAETGARLLPNTAGCYSAREAITTAAMARETFATEWIKLEVIADPESLHPDPFGLVEAARELTAEGFKVLPYCTEDPAIAEKLLAAGCRVLMPWGSPIGSARGLNNLYGLRLLRARFSDIPLIVDAGLGLPSHAAQALELGYDGVLLNTAVAKADCPVKMAQAFAKAVEAGRIAHEAGPLAARDMATPSTPMVGIPSF